MRVLVLGGYGLIGSQVCRHLLATDHAPVGLGRSARKGKALFPQLEWYQADLARLSMPAAWRPYLEGIDAVVNAAGLLQSGLADDVDAVQRAAMLALYAACEADGPARIVQISAPGAHPGSDTDFYASKGRADAALQASGLNWTILRPGLVISADAYGGTALLRGLAAFPLVQPLTLPDAEIDLVAVSDVGRAVCDALDGRYSRADLDLVSPDRPSLRELTLRIRAWLGFPTPRAVIALPGWIAVAIGWGADLAGHLGWRSALRSTAQRVLTTGVRGDGAGWRAAGGHELQSADEIFAALPATAQERRFARIELLFPLLLLLFSAFWIASGVIGLFRLDAAAALVSPTFGPALARAFVIAGSTADIAIGALALFRPTSRHAAGASILLALAYLVGASLVIPALWLDPLGPLVKVVPAIALGALLALLPASR